ncbi:MAG TPA: YdcF family protein, partial [Enterococcus sp.]|nr:YdcF family protein [Enterococcus sp.]
YALTQNIPESNILVETNSTTTLENMQFSKEIIRQNFGENANVIFSSNNYHIFRAGIFARWAGLKADGIGSKTALYYLPNAFLREFIAIVAMNKKRHFLIVGLLAAIILALTVVVLIGTYWAT